MEKEKMDMSDWIYNHQALSIGLYLIGCTAVMVPLCVLSGKMIGKAAGKEIAKQLIRNF